MAEELAEWLARNGTSIADTGGAKTAHEFDSLVRPVLEQRPDLWPPASCGYDAFVHAAGMVQSRAFHMKKENWITGENEDGEELYLIPGIDMINHSSRLQERNTALEQSSDGVTFRRKPDLPPEEYNGGLFVMKAGRKVAAGEQILHTYGDLSDAQLLQTYGFVEDPARPNRHNRNVRLPTSDLQKGIRALRRHHKPDADRDDSWINIEEVEERLLVGKQRHDDLFKLAAYYVTGKAECLIMLSLVDKQLDGRLAAPNRHIKAAAATGRLRMAAVVREAEEKALRGLKNQIFQLLMAAPYNADDATAMDGEDCLGDLQWEPPEEELYPESSGDSEDEDGSEEDLEGSDEDSEDPEEEEEKEEEEEEAENLNGVEASSFRDQAPETAGGKELAGGGADAPSADESALLSASVLPATEKRGRRSSTVSLRIGDPVRKRLKF
ncbi:SET domain-containing protein [Coccomyxa subellipsoidea C-169]|uniref:SET domain-containing protein n=1 Tax=Coccomyxa subellipsoidea (strain C-169) TaxID=574566 RepID=I0YWJ2_COCSC|nr:SET domain-containing protein [Coccomyxa subellipsoidea C-169]EIE22761.1 SET domain-containing protein [Coccomyxa subellipsoidea C-169]|eukprot:XP_005647305.1 SET domain-containing protein [Coccomyxa subellipsoidea C-169]